MNKNSENRSDNLIDRVNQEPEMQLKVIQHFFPQATIKNKFKTHEENTPSSSIKFRDGKYWLKNFASSEKAMDCFNVAEKQLELEMAEVIKYLVHNLFPEYQFKETKNISDRSPFEKQLYAIKNNPKQEAREYLEGRGIECDKLPQGAFYQNLSQDKKADGIVFLDSNEKLINKRFFDEKDKRSRYLDAGEAGCALYTKCFQEDKDTVFITEGVIDTLSLFPTYSSIATFSASNRMSKAVIENYIQDKKVVIALDNDEGGNEAAEILYQNILEWNISVISIHRLEFPLKKDANKLLKEGELFNYLESKENNKQLYPDYIPDSENEIEDFEKNQFFIRNSCYYTKKYIRGKICDVDISNFVMKILYFFPGCPEKSKRIIALQNEDGKTEVMVVSAREIRYNNVDSHLSGRGGFSFWGSIEIYKRILNELDKTSRNVWMFDILGYQPKYDIYAFNNGIIYGNKFRHVDRMGMVNYGHNSIYLPAFSLQNKDDDDYKMARTFAFEEGEIGFSLWIELFFKAFRERAMMGVIFLIGTIFRDFIIDKLGFFPHLYLFGDYGVGKTAFSNLIIKIFGSHQSGIGLESNPSVVGISRVMSQYRNVVLYLQEMDREQEVKHRGAIKGNYDGGNSTKGVLSNDNRTRQDNYSSGLLIDGNYIPSASGSLASRMSKLNFRSQDFTEEETKAFKELSSSTNSGFGSVLIDILKNSSNFKSSFMNYFNEIHEDLKKDSHINILQERNIKHAALYLTIYNCLKSKLNFPFSFETFYEYVIELAIEQDHFLKRIGDVNHFWNVINTQKTLGRVVSKLYRVFTKDDKKVFAIIFDPTYDLYRQSCISLHDNYADRNTLLALLKNQKYFIPTWHKGRGDSHNIKDFGSAYLFEFEKLPLEKELWLK